MYRRQKARNQVIGIDRFKLSDTQRLHLLKDFFSDNGVTADYHFACFFIQLIFGKPVAAHIFRWHFERF